MKDKIRRVLRGFIVFCFHIASKLMRHRPHLQGGEHLRKVPMPLIVTVTHDSYFEIPSLSRVYYKLKPLPDFTMLAKDDFLSGRYLSTNYCQKNSVMKFVMLLLDLTQLPKAIFRIMKLTPIHRPFAESYQKKKEAIKAEIKSQIGSVRESISLGWSTVIFPEGTTWGRGGLKRIRSIVYQLVENARTQAGKDLHILPINVKVDRLIKGTKDVFINVGSPVFLQAAKDDFNSALSVMLQRLHTITFSQIAAYYFKRMAEIGEETNSRIDIARDKFAARIESIVADLNALAERHALPQIDSRLLEREYLCKKINGFLKYCRKKRYLFIERLREHGETLVLNVESVLSSPPERHYRKQNPLGFSANELASIGGDTIRRIFDAHLGSRRKPAV